MYSLFGVGLQLARGEDDEFNTLTAATATGLLYKASGNYILITYKMMNSIHSQLPQRQIYCIKLQVTIYSLHTQCVGEDDEFNTLTAATATGLLYKASGKYILVTYRVCGRR